MLALCLTILRCCGIVLYLKGSGHMTTLENLWYGNIHPYEKSVPKESEYAKAVKLCIRHTDALAATLTDAQKETLDKLITAQTEQSSLGECDAFIRGFVIGGRIMQEVNSAKI